MWRIYPDDLVAQAKDSIADLEKSMHAVIETEHITRDGRRFPVMIDVTVIRSSDDDLVTRIAYVPDITDRKRAEAQLAEYHEHLEEVVEQRSAELTQAKLAAEAASIAKSAFLAQMSHEIRTPISGILGMAHILRRSRLDGAQRDSLGKIEASGRHLLGIIDDILDLLQDRSRQAPAGATSRSTTCCATSRPSPAPPSPPRPWLCVATSLPTCRPACMATRTADPGHRQLHRQRHQIHRARQHRADQGITPAENAGHVLLRFAVADTGIGIEAEALARIFGLFSEQADCSTTRKFRRHRPA